MYGSRRFASRFIAHVSTPLYRNAYALMLNSVTTSVLGMGYWILAARNYTTAAVGLNSAAISAMMFLAGVAQLNLMGAELRFIPGAGQATARLVTYIYLISVSVAAVICFVFIRGLGIWAPTLGFLGSNPFLAVWFTLSTMAWCIFVLQDSALIGLRQAIWVPIENGVFSVAKIAFLIGLAASFPRYGLFASWSIGMVLTLLPVNVLIFRRLIPKHMAKVTDHIAPLIPGQVFKYVAADYVGSLCWLASTSLLPLMITQQAGATANAYFFLSWQIAYLLFLMSSNMGSSLLVEAVNDPSNLRAYTYRTALQIVRTVVPAAVILVLGAPYILRVFGNNYAGEATSSLRLLALSALPFIVTTLYTCIMRVQRRMKSVVTVQLASCVLVLVMSHFLLGTYGIQGVGVAWLISQTLIALVLVWTPELRPLWSRRLPGVLLQGIYSTDAHGAARGSDGTTGLLSRSADTVASTPRFEASRLRSIDLFMADWMLGTANHLRLSPLLGRLRDYGTNRHRLAEVTKLLPSILPTVTPPIDGSLISTWIIRRSIATVTDMTVVSIGPRSQSPLALLKLAETDLALMSLQRQREVLTSLHADDRLGEWRMLLSSVLAVGEIDGRAYMVEQMLPGHDARRRLADREVRERMLTAAAAAVGWLHMRTTRLMVADNGTLKRWIDEPLSVIRSNYRTHPSVADTDRAIGRLATELHSALKGRMLCVSWVHGDFTPGNILVSADGRTLTGIVDWDQAVPDGLSLLDLVLLLLSVRMAVERRELGDVVRSVLNGAGWTAHEQGLIDTLQAALPGEGIAWRVMVLLCWLGHVQAHLTKSARTGGRLWAKRNIEVVLRCL
jgi:aminoglycoside phosphotransferase (APT) family kinase protein/O-antigen/teichoic acid export membrane protein